MSGFEDLGLRPELVRAVTELGYEEPTPIQISAIPALMAGEDVLGQAQTGTGKTAAFALPLLQNFDPSDNRVQGLVIVPTRELATQVAEAIFRYGQHLGARVLPVYGGQAYSRQLSRLERGVHVVVGTPGRLIDLIDRKALKLNHVRYLVLDEADEMLDMGFIEDVEKILKETPKERQTALFSATLPPTIRGLADRYMHQPQEITIAHKTMTVPQVEQRYYLIEDKSKLAALTRLLEVEDITSALVFSRTKLGAAGLAEQLQSRGYTAEAIHGDLTQDMRETALRRFRNGQLQLLIATDVVARGVDIVGVSHVINYDIPYDAEDYVHRIGRTGRAGRSGVAITLVTPRDQRRLKYIESFTKQSIQRVSLPKKEAVYARRNERFQERLAETLDSQDLSRERELVEQMISEGVDLNDITAAAIRLARASEAQRPVEDVRVPQDRDDRPRRDRERPGGDRRGKPTFPQQRGRKEAGMVRLRLDVGKAEGVRPGDVVGAIASEVGIPGRSIGAIEIQAHQTFVDVLEAHAERVLRHKGRWMLRGHQVKLVRAKD